MPELTFATDRNDMLLTETEAAEILAVSVRTIQNWRIRGGGPPFYKLVAKTVRYRLGDLVEWLEQNRRGSTSEYCLP